MYIRMVQAHVDPTKLEEIQKTYNQRVVRELEKVPGCLCARLVQSAAHEDEVLSMTLWDTEEHAEAYEESGLFRKLIKEAEAWLSESAEWKIQLTKDLTLEYRPIEQEPVVKVLPVVEQSDATVSEDGVTGTMHMRIVAPKIQPGKLEEFKRLYRQEIIPALQNVPGCRYAYLVESRDGEIYSITIWDREEDAEHYERSGLFDQLTSRVEHTLSELFQWKLALEKQTGKKLATSEDLKVDHYKIVTGKRFQ